MKEFRQFTGNSIIIFLTKGYIRSFALCSKYKFNYSTTEEPAQQIMEDIRRDMATINIWLTGINVSVTP